MINNIYNSYFFWILIFSLCSFFFYLYYLIYNITKGFILMSFVSFLFYAFFLFVITFFLFLMLVSVYYCRMLWSQTSDGFVLYIILWLAFISWPCVLLNPFCLHTWFTEILFLALPVLLCFIFFLCHLHILYRNWVLLKWIIQVACLSLKIVFIQMKSFWSLFVLAVGFLLIVS